MHRCACTCVGDAILYSPTFEQQHCIDLALPLVQVVLLGSGMDSRPWRLRLPTGVAWFEVDRSDVLRAKRRLLERAGAAFAAEEGSVRAGHPLCCSSWAGVPLDLQEAGWAEELKAKGFRPSQPTVWVLEGLLYYLEPDSVPAMLKVNLHRAVPVLFVHPLDRG